VWHRLFVAGKLNAAQAQFWEPKAVEELYDLRSDPDEVKNLVADGQHDDVLRRMRAAHEQWEKRIKDVGLLAESEMLARSEGTTPYEMGHDPKKYDFDSVFAAASLATAGKPADLKKIVELLGSKDSGVRYWAATGLLIQGKDGVAVGQKELKAALGDSSPAVRIVAAEALGRFGSGDEAAEALKVLLHCARPEGPAFVAVEAWNALDYLDERARPALSEIRALGPQPIAEPQRYGGYGQRLKEQALKDLK
jgi:uncharacterized sulfatase